MTKAKLTTRAKGSIEIILGVEPPFTKEHAKQIAKLTEEELLDRPNFARGSLNSIVAWLKTFGLKLSSNPKRCPHCGQIIRSRINN